MTVFYKFFRRYAEVLLLSLAIAKLQISIRGCNSKLVIFKRDTDTIRNLKDQRFGYQIEAESLSVRVHRLMAVRKLKAQSAQERPDEWKG